MAASVEHIQGLPAGVRVPAQGVEFNVGWGIRRTHVEIAVDFPNDGGVGVRFVKLSRVEWDQVVAFIAGEHQERSVEA